MTAPCDDWPEDWRRRLKAPLPLAHGAPDWRRRIRAAWTAALPAPDPVANFQDGTLHFASGKQVRGIVLVPDRITGCAVLLLHDHGGRFDQGWRKMVTDPQGFYGGAPAQRLVAAGHPVFCFDTLGWGDRQMPGDQQALACTAMGLGTSLAGLVAGEDRDIAAWIAARPEARRGLAAWGFSFGAFRAWQALATSDHVTAAVAISWMAWRRDLLRLGAPLSAGQAAFWMLHPSLTGLADLPDLAMAGAPKPLFLRSGDADRHLPLAAVAPAFAHLHGIWGGRLDAEIFPGGHVCPPEVQQQAIAFLM
ncbi:hydrolase (plasmid) [Paracoccus liaowanqingii]|uniref:Hydrolase n=1 Tax=Paracoccus liaowanqingii TaxID=2560053 RepID=A0A4Y5SRE1_9RHOB|nr:hydrolase [Paracoccus liaowanqingii]QDA36067.1 hydrolase [Paracoccus liaowanqingii]